MFSDISKLGDNCLILAVCIVLFFVAEVYGLAIFFSLIKLHAASYNLNELKYSFFRQEVRKWLLPSLLLYILIALMAAILMFAGVFFLKSMFNNPEPNTWMGFAGLFFFVLFFIVFLPICPVVCMSVVLSGKKFFPAVGAGLALAFRYFGKVFATSLLMALSVGILNFIIMLPSEGISYVIQYCNLATMAGDYTPLPSGIMFWGGLICLVSAMFSNFFFFMFMSIPAYLYSSIKINYEEKLANTGEY